MVWIDNAESAVPVLLFSESLLQICRRYCQRLSQKSGANLLLLVPDLCCWTAVHPIPPCQSCLPKCPLHSGLLSLLRGTERQILGRRNSLGLLLFSRLQLRGSQGDIYSWWLPDLKRERFPSPSSLWFTLPCSIFKQIRYKIPLGTLQFNSNKFATDQHCCAWT